MKGYLATLVLSAGTEPAGNLNPLATEAMKEVGIDISKQRPKIITEDMIRQSTAITKRWDVPVLNWVPRLRLKPIYHLE
jgi:protein-tyrosine-phosphatase